MATKLIVCLLCSLFCVLLSSKSSALNLVVDGVFSPPANSVVGLAWDGNNLWASSRDTTLIYKLDPADLSVLGTIPTPYGPYGGGSFSSSTDLAWDGQYLWSIDEIGDQIYQIDPADGSVVSSVPTPEGGSWGIAWDGANLLVQDDILDRIYRIDPSDGSVLSSFAAPGCCGLTWDGASLWSAVDGNAFGGFPPDSIYQIDPTDGTVLAAYSAPGGIPVGLEWDGSGFWHSDIGSTDTIYHLVLVPEPATCLLMGFGLIGLGLRKKFII